MAADTDTDRARSISGIIALTLACASGAGCGGGTTTSADDFSDDSCGESMDSAVEVAAWNVSMERYEAIQAAAPQHGGLTWDELDDESRCRLACAYASGHLQALDESQYTEMLTLDSCTLTIPTPDADGELSCTGTHTEEIFCLGRRPLALAGEAVASALSCRQELLDGSALLEHVSVTAFTELAAQLRSLGAPAPLIERCEAAALDERRHVDLLVALGARRPEQSPAAAAPETSVLEIALHNASEGCASETWAALLARHQAEHASTAAQRQAFAEIAADEARHADLAWALHDWLCRCLEADEARCVEEARSRALASLEARAREQALAVPPQLREALGLPAPRVAAALARDFGRRLAAA